MKKSLKIGYKQKTYLGVLGFILSSGKTRHTEEENNLKGQSCDPDKKSQSFQNDTPNLKCSCKQVVPVQHG